MPVHTKTKTTSLAYLFALISLVTICDFIFFIDNRQYELGIFGALACMSLLLLPLVIFYRSPRLYLLLLLPVFILLPFNIASVVLFNVPVNNATLLIIQNTTLHESVELLKGYFPILLACLLLYSALLYLLVRRVPRTLPFKVAGLISACSLAILLMMPLLRLSGAPYRTQIIARLYTVFPTSLFFSLKEVYQMQQLVNVARAERENYRFQATQESTYNGKQLVVLIIGESARYDHWGINGYARNTSPRLSKRKNLISFSQVAAGGFITEFAVPLLLTGVGADHFEAHFRQRSITSAFHEAGFQTYWITNQIDDSHIKIHQEEADKKIFLQSDFRATKNIHQDMELVEAMKQVLREPGDKKFVVLHTTGSHYDYSARYPDQFDKMKPSNKTVFSKAADKAFKKELINSYDNSILYSDAVIDSTISMVAAQGAQSSVTYIADHGENLLDDERNLTQHAYPVPSKYIAHVPMFVWYSPSLEASFSDKVTNLKKNAHSKVASESIIHTLTSLSGIHFPAQDSLKDLSGGYYRINNQKILGANSKVYDAAQLK